MSVDHLEEKSTNGIRMFFRVSKPELLPIGKELASPLKDLWGAFGSP